MKIDLKIGYYEQASHLNLEDNLDKEQYTKLLEYAVQVGNNYITFNVPQTQCDDCGFIAKHPFNKCPKCGSKKCYYMDKDNRIPTSFKGMV